jgi:hypothetical protein
MKFKDVDKIKVAISETLLMKGNIIGYQFGAKFKLVLCAKYDRGLDLGFWEILKPLKTSDNRNTRSTCPTSVFTGIGQMLMSRPDVQNYV